MTDLVGKILKVPKEIVESGFIKIVADASHCLPSVLVLYYKWDYLFIPYDPQNPNEINSLVFQASKEEIKQWIK